MAKPLAAWIIFLWPRFSFKLLSVKEMRLVPAVTCPSPGSLAQKLPFGYSVLLSKGNRSPESPELTMFCFWSQKVHIDVNWLPDDLNLSPLLPPVSHWLTYYHGSQKDKRGSGARTAAKRNCRDTKKMPDQSSRSSIRHQKHLKISYEDLYGLSGSDQGRQAKKHDSRSLSSRGLLSALES